jgi:hypothetical protein
MVNYLDEVGRVAQLVEQCPFKAWVAGSNPAALTKPFFRLSFIGVLRFFFGFLPVSFQSSFGSSFGSRAAALFGGHAIGVARYNGEEVEGSSIR